MPNLITAEYFQAIIEATDADPEYLRFKNVVIKSSIHYALLARRLHLRPAAGLNKQLKGS